MSAEGVTKRAREARTLDPSTLAHGAVEIARADGCWMFDGQGRRYFDASAGSGAVNLGHGYRPVVDACMRQMATLVHVGWNFASLPRTQLCEALADFLPFPDPSVLFTVTGAEAIEAAIKLARAATGRDWLVAFENGFHGKTAGALTVTWSQAFRRYGLVPSDVTEFAPFLAQSPEVTPGDVSGCLTTLGRVLRSRSTPPAAIVVEPVQGAEGIQAASDAFLAGVIAAAHEVGTLVIFDEIYTGFGRCGSPFVASRPGLLPDLLAIGKALANGMPMSAVVGPPALVDALPSGGHSSTFAGHPVSCAAASAVIQAMQTLRPWERSGTLGTRLQAVLRDLRADLPVIGPPRGVGLMVAFDCVDRRGTPDAALARRFLQTLAAHGVLARGGGATGATIKLTPPLTISDAELEFLVDAIRASASQVGN